MFTYTTLFGVLVSYVYVRTGNLLAAGLVHSLCNFFSIPSFEYNRPSSPLYSKRTSFLFSIISLVVINGAYVVGVILFIVLFPILLNPQWCKSQFLLILYLVCCEIYLKWNNIQIKQEVHTPFVIESSILRLFHSPFGWGNNQYLVISHFLHRSKYSRKRDYRIFLRLFCLDKSTFHNTWNII